MPDDLIDDPADAAPTASEPADPRDDRPNWQGWDDDWGFEERGALFG